MHISGGRKWRTLRAKMETLHGRHAQLDGGLDRGLFMSVMLLAYSNEGGWARKGSS